jgi:uncharacterized Zn-binding protein involved in type VI secretion
MAMNKAGRRGDLCTGHDVHGPRPAIKGSPDVTVNDRPALRSGDAFAKHGPTRHGGSLSAGSATVTFNDKPASRVGDALDCGSSLGVGSDDVLVGD